MEPSMAGLFQVLKGSADGTFKKAAELKGTDGEPLIIPIKDEKEQVQNICTRPTAVDWDGDGKLDLVVGNFAGSFYLFHGEGKGQFAPKPEVLMADAGPLQIKGVHSDPFVVDIDGDGDLDIVSGSSNGGVQWAENTAGKGKKPELKQFVALIAPSADVPYGQPVQEDNIKGPSNSTRVWVDDVNGDGKLDILLGDNVTLVSPAKGLSLAEFKKKSDEWQKEFEQATRINAADKEAAEKASKRINELYAARQKFVSEDRTGFIWLYLAR
ncbi:MAG: VCBS repeat-containing protein [Planctomycetes bacterium]|nr:VCBS repeat-containing protein [Planctomycetota bacterium]